MAAIVIQVTGFGGEPNGDIYYGGLARVEGMTNDDPSIRWACRVAPTALESAHNAAMKDAAVAAAVAAGYTVDALDAKTLIGAAVRL